MSLPNGLVPRLSAKGSGDHLIYIHGFNSSAQAMKARQVAEYLQAQGLPINYWTPDLPVMPIDAMAFLGELVAYCCALAQKNNGRVALIGSSLGGYYAAWLAEQYGLRAALINPAVYPYRHMTRHIGPQHNPYTDVHYSLEAEDVACLQRWDVAPFKQPEDILVLVQTGDEVLDYAEAIAKYPDVRHHIEQGGDHHFIGFDQQLPSVLQFLGFQA